MEKLLNLRVSNEFMQALDETKWTLRKSMAEVIRDAAIEYMERHLPKEVLEKVRKMLESERGPKPKKGSK